MEKRGRRGVTEQVRLGGPCRRAQPPIGDVANRKFSSSKAPHVEKQLALLIFGC